MPGRSLSPTSAARRTGLVALTALAAALASLSAPSVSAHAADDSEHRAKPGVAWRVLHGPPTRQQLRGLDSLDRRHVVVAGENGGVFSTASAGRHWRDITPKGTKGTLAFRDVEITSVRHIQVLAIGEGDASRIYRTVDGGRHWRTTFVNRSKTAFYDCMAMFPNNRDGLAVSDPVDGKFRIIATHNGGRTWRILPRSGMPKTVDGEFGFAGSGTCIATGPRGQAYFGSGGGASRVFHSNNYGRRWTVRSSTIPAGAEGGGTFSIDVRGPRVALAVGGDYTRPGRGKDAAAITSTRGARWRNVGDLHGYRSGVSWLGPHSPVAIAVGPNGSDFTRSKGRHWTRFAPKLPLDAVTCARGACWGSGPDGTVARLIR